MNFQTRALFLNSLSVLAVLDEIFAHCSIIHRVYQVLFNSYKLWAFTRFAVFCMYKYNVTRFSKFLPFTRILIWYVQCEYKTQTETKTVFSMETRRNPLRAVELVTDVIQTWERIAITPLLVLGSNCGVKLRVDV